MNSFVETGLNDQILQSLEDLGFETPTPIQAKTIPHLLQSDQDVIALAQTGTGKTAAFGLPAIHLTELKDKDVQTIILCPTRELCLQITRDMETFAKHTKGLNIVAVYGGASIETQIRGLRRGAQIVVGTPGRTRDLIRRRVLKMDKIKRVILDEADEMLTMGFQEEMEAILAETPEEKQTLLFSATMSKEIKRVTKNYMTDPIEMAVARVNIGAENVKHVYYMVHSKYKYEVLKRLADITPDIYGIVFCRTRRDTQEIANKLMHDGYSADAIHGDLSQAQRDEVMGRFRSRSIQILVATDVAARGLDVNDLTHVINYNLPDSPETYTHRSGRTGRAGKSGISVAILHTREGRKLKDIERISGVNFERVMVPSGKEICEKQLFTLIDKIEKVEVNEKQIEPFLPAIYEKLEWLSREQLIQHFVSAEFNRFLAYYKNAKDINPNNLSGRDSRERNHRDRSDRRERPDRSDRSRNRGDRDDRGDRRDRRDSRDRGDRDRGDRDRGDRDRGASSGFTRLFINLGTKNSLNPLRLISMVNEGLDSSSAEIGKIEVMKKFSFFEVESKHALNVITALKKMQVEGVDVVVEPSEEKPQVRVKSKTDYGPKRDHRDSRSGGRRSGGGYNKDRNKRKVTKRKNRK